MAEIIPGATDAARENHVPVYQAEGNKVLVTVGEVERSMEPEHYIERVSLQTKQGNWRKLLESLSHRSRNSPAEQLMLR